MSHTISAGEVAEVVKESMVKKVALFVFLSAAAFFVGGLIAAAVCAAVMVMIWAKIGVDSPDKHGISQFSANRLGGVLILGYMAFATLWIYFFDGVALLHPDLWAVLIAASAIFAIGLIEDVTGLLPAHTRLLLMSVVLVSLLFWDSQLPMTTSSFSGLDWALAWSPFALVFSLMGILFLINAFNAADGANGLLSGVALVALWVLLHTENSAPLWVIYPLWTGIMVFALINVFTGKLFMGDSGAYFLGVVTAVMLIYAANNQWTSTWLLLTLVFYPTADFLVSVIRRLFAGGSIMAADNYHFHNMVHQELSRSGWKPLTANSLTGIFVVLCWSLPSLVLFELEVPAATWPWVYFFYTLSFLGLWVFFYRRMAK